MTHNFNTYAKCCDIITLFIQSTDKIYPHWTLHWVDLGNARLEPLLLSAALILNFIGSTRCWKPSSEILVYLDMIASQSSCGNPWCNLHRTPKSNQSIRLRWSDWAYDWDHLSIGKSLSCSRNHFEVNFCGNLEDKYIVVVTGWWHYAINMTWGLVSKNIAGRELVNFYLSKQVVSVLQLWLESFSLTQVSVLSVLPTSKAHYATRCISSQIINCYFCAIFNILISLYTTSGYIYISHSVLGK